MALTMLGSLPPYELPTHRQAYNRLYDFRRRKLGLAPLVQREPYSAAELEADRIAELVEMSEIVISWKTGGPEWH